MRGLMPSFLSWANASVRSAKNDLLRTSTTAAMRGTFPCARPPSSVSVGSRAGGRLSTTNQPRSSKTFAAVLRPAPDMPVMMTRSGSRGAALSSASRTWLVTSFLHRCWAGVLSSRISPVAVLTARPPVRSPAASAATTASAVCLPTPGTSMISSTEAAASRLREPNCLSSALRLVSPSPAMPSRALAVIDLDRRDRWWAMAKR